jgi:hypothetical protein
LVNATILAQSSRCADDRDDWIDADTGLLSHADLFLKPALGPPDAYVCDAWFRLRVAAAFFA